MTDATTPVAAPDFNGLGIAPKLFEVLAANKFVSPTPIQLQSIPVALEGKDVIGIAQTGTGKTLAFSVPMLQRLATVQGRGLVVLPTRELALQVEETLIKIGRPLGLRTAMLIGGASMGRQFDMLRNKPHIIVGTPGRINDHLQQKTLSLKDVKVLVLDEADRMLDMGFWPQIQKILAGVPKERQTLLFSATMPPEITKLAVSEMQMPVRIEVAPAGTTADKVAQEIFLVRREEKSRLLESLLMSHKGPVLVFSRTKHGAHRIAGMVKTMGHTAADIHSDRSLNQRREALEGFKRGKYRVLVATDIAARGIDVQGIELVVNYDLPENTDDYVHRIGRTARNGMNGKAVSFAQPDQKHLIRDIERLVRKTIPVSPTPADLPPARAQERSTFERGGYGGGRDSRGGFGGGYSGRRDGERRPSYGDTRNMGGGRGGYQSEGRAEGQAQSFPRSERPHFGRGNGQRRSGGSGRSGGNFKGRGREQHSGKFYFGESQK